MSTILKNAIAQAERLSPQDQATLAAEIEKRAYDLWLEAEVQKGIDSADRGELIPAEQVFAELRARLRDQYGV